MNTAAMPQGFSLVNRIVSVASSIFDNQEKQVKRVRAIKNIHDIIELDGEVLASSEITVLTDFNNVDSLIAWGALVSSGLVAQVSRPAYYNRSSGRFYKLDKNKLCIVLGLDIAPMELSNLSENFKKVIVFSYVRNGRKDSMPNKVPSNVEYIYTYGSEEEALLLQDGIDPSEYDSICSYLLKLDPEFVKFSLIEPSVFKFVGKYFNLQGMGNHSTSLEDIVKLRHVKGILTEAVHSGSPCLYMQARLFQPITEIEFKSLTINTRRVREALSDNVRQASYGTGRTRVIASTICIDGSNYHEYLYNAMMSNDTLVGYTDEIHQRIWRVYSSKRSVTEIIEEYLRPNDVWMEGPVTCMATKLPVFEP